MATCAEHAGETTVHPNCATRNALHLAAWVTEFMAVLEDNAVAAFLEKRDLTQMEAFDLLNLPRQYYLECKGQIRHVIDHVPPFLLRDAHFVRAAFTDI